MSTVRLIFGSTNSQPVGTTDDDIEKVYQRSYKPFLRALYNAPAVPVTLHFSGQLLQWLERHHSEYTDVLSEMVGRKQIELLGGGFYDPVLSLIPRADRVGQIESLTTYLRKRFGRRPRGTWITQHVWEPSLASTLKSSGMDFVFLDDYHFLAAGFTGDDLARPCITEDQGKTVTVFPVSNELQRIARDGEPEDVIVFLKGHASDDPSQVFVLIDEGERSSVTPQPDSGPTPHNLWLEHFVELLPEHPWIDVVLPATYMKERRPRTRGYFPSASYDEMSYWTLAPERKESYEIVRKRFEGSKNGHFVGGFFRQFLTRYSESNLMYAKMQYTHVLVNQIRGDKYRKQAAREELWKGQCHSAYWHGNHCGIYSNRLRKHVYRSLIEAEKKTRERGIFIPSVISVDFDMDGMEEFLYQGHDLNGYVHSQGGILFELDYLPKCWNYLDTLARRRESYHTGEVEARGYDASPRKSFVDRFLDADVTLQAFARSEYVDHGGFHAALYERGDRKRDTHLISLAATGPVMDSTLRIEKKYRFKRNTVQAEYSLTHLDGPGLDLLFAPELNFAFLSDKKDDLEMVAVNGGSREINLSKGAQGTTGTSELRMRDLINRTLVTLTASEPADTWIMPVETVSASEDGMVTTYQGTSVVPRFPLALASGEQKQFSLAIRLERG